MSGVLGAPEGQRAERGPTVSRALMMNGPTPLRAPEMRLGKYMPIADLGQGGMADVFLAIARGPSGFNKLTVVKVLRPHLAIDPEVLAMFLDEGRLAARLNHPNVVQTNEVGHEQGVHFMAMEYLEGQSLHRMIRSARGDDALDLALHVRVLCDILAGLHHAHELCDYDGTPMAVVHRDVSPHNVLLTYDGQVKLLDFGIAKAVNSSPHTSTGIVKGKIAYMAPEQACGEGVDRRADLFAVGVMLWEAVAGSRMWGGEEGNVLTRLLNGDIPKLRARVPAVRDDLDAIVARALAFSRDDRYPTAASMRADLHAVLQRLGHQGDDQLGARVSAAFVEQRRAIRAVVDARLRSPVDSGFASDANQLPSFHASGETSSYGRASTLDASSMAAANVRAADQGGRARRSFGLFAVAAALAAGALALGRPASPTRAGGVAPSTPGGPQAAEAVESRVLARAPEVEISIDASPATARISLDGVPLPESTYRGRLAADDATHEVRVEAHGYRSVTRRFTPTTEPHLEIALQPERAVAAPTSARRTAGAPLPAAAASSAGPPERPTPTTTAARGLGQRPIDWKDPWQ